MMTDFEHAVDSGECKDWSDKKFLDYRLKLKLAHIAAVRRAGRSVKPVGGIAAALGSSSAIAGFVRLAVSSWRNPWVVITFSVVAALVGIALYAVNDHAGMWKITAEKYAETIAMLERVRLSTKAKRDADDAARRADRAKPPRLYYAMTADGLTSKRIGGWATDQDAHSTGDGSVAATSPPLQTTGVRIEPASEIQSEHDSNDGTDSQRGIALRGQTGSGSA